MSQITFIVDQLRRAFAGDAWHGPALMEILAEVDAASASARPISKAHTIWELTLHITAWDNAILRRIAGEAASPTDEREFPEGEGLERTGVACDSCEFAKPASGTATSYFRNAGLAAE